MCSSDDGIRTTEQRGLQSTELCGADDSDEGFVHDTEHGYNVRVFRLSDKFGDNSNVIHGALSVGHSHDAHEEVNLSSLPRVVVAYGYQGKSNFIRPSTKPRTILRPWNSVKVEVYTNAIFSAPFE